MKHYAYLLLPEFSNLCLFNSIEPLRAANSFINGNGYKWSLVSMDGKPVTSSSGFEMRVDYCIDELVQLDKPDALLVLASYNYQRHSTTALTNILRQLKNKIGIIGGLDAGSYPLAKAKLLNGFKATIHWAELEVFGEEFREIEVCNNRYVIDRNRISSGGATTALDLMLSIIRLDFGNEVAIAVSNLLIFDTERPSGTPQRETVLAMVDDQTPRLARAIKLMESNIETPLTASQIASQTFVSQRQLERDFKKILGNSITGYYSRLRVMFAQRLLSETSLSATQIAVRAGYNSRASFNRSYKRILGKYPTCDRKVL